jgi:hypothetical protein
VNQKSKLEIEKDVLFSERNNLLYVQNELFDSQIVNKKLSEELRSLETIINKDQEVQMVASTIEPGLF